MLLLEDTPSKLPNYFQNWGNPGQANIFTKDIHPSYFYPNVEELRYFLRVDLAYSSFQHSISCVIRIT